MYEFYLRNLYIDPNNKLVQLNEDNRVVVNLTDCIGHLSSKYKYITDPPLLADIGDFDWVWNDTSFTIDLKVYLNETPHLHPEVKIYAIDFEADPFDISLDGVSDLS